MSHISPTSLGRPGFVSVPPRAAARRRTPTPVLITEHEVAFSTAAAASTTMTNRRSLYTTWLADLGRILTTLTGSRPYCPRRESNYFEVARMSRAMDRL
jgi:hypothetical protein